MPENKAPEMNTIVCPDCDCEVSGPDKEDVAATAARHAHSTGHSTARQVRAKARAKVETRQAKADAKEAEEVGEAEPVMPPAYTPSLAYQGPSY